MAIHSKVFFNLEDVPAELDLRVLICCGLHIIQERTGARLSLCGRGSGGLDSSPEPLHLKVEHSNLKSLVKAREMAVEVAKSIQLECDKFCSLRHKQRNQVGTPVTQRLPPTWKNYYSSDQAGSDWPLLSLGESAPREDRSQAAISELTLYKRSSENNESSKKFKPNKETDAKVSSFREINGFSSTQRNEPSHSFTSKPFQSSYGTSQISAVNSQTSSIPTVQQSRPDEKSVLTPRQRILPHLQSDVQTDHEINHGMNLRQSEHQVVRKLTSAGMSVDTTMKGPLVLSPQSTTKLISTHQQSQSVTQAIQQRKEVSIATSSACPVPNYSIQSNLGPLTVQLCAKNESLYAAVANHLFGPFRSLTEQALSACTLHRRAVDCVRSKKELFFYQVKSFYDKTHRLHNLDADTAFESGCFDLLSDNGEISWMGHHILLQAVVNLFKESISIYEEVKTVGGLVTLKLAFKVNHPQSGPSETPICIWRRQSPENHYDSLCFVKPEHCVKEGGDVGSASIPLYMSVENLMKDLPTKSTPVKEAPRSSKYFRISTWHIDNCLDKKRFDTIELKLSHDYHSFVCIQTEMLSFLPRVETTNYCCWFGGKSTGNSCVGFLLLKKKNIHLINFTDHAPGIISAEVSSDGSTFHVIGCYSQSFGTVHFSHNLNQVISSFPLSTQLFVLGEFSADEQFSRFRKEQSHLIGPSFVETTPLPNMKESHLMKTAIKHQLCFFSTWKTTADTPATFRKYSKSFRNGDCKQYQTSHILFRKSKAVECVGNVRSWHKAHSRHAIVCCHIDFKSK